MTVLKINNRSVYYDAGLLKDLSRCKKIIKKDWDMVYIVDGREGSGKSVFAQQMALFLDNTLSLDRIVFTPDQFIKAIDKAEKYQAIIYDEAYTGFDSSSALSSINKTIRGKLSRIRRKNLYLFIVAPNFWSMSKYIAIWRSMALIHIHTDKGLNRGYFALWGYESKKKLYIKGKELYNYCVRPNMIGRFTKKWIVDSKEYDAKKEAAEYENAQEDNATEIKYKEQRNALIYYLADQFKLSQRNIADKLTELTEYKMSRETVRDILTKHRRF